VARANLPVEFAGSGKRPEDQRDRIGLTRHALDDFDVSRPGLDGVSRSTRVSAGNATLTLELARRL
jgi:hypothetical protein